MIITSSGLRATDDHHSGGCRQAQIAVCELLNSTWNCIGRLSGAELRVYNGDTDLRSAARPDRALEGKRKLTSFGRSLPYVCFIPVSPAPAGYTVYDRKDLRAWRGSKR